jgi:mono/diheme cytochrome c family protein
MRSLAYYVTLLLLACTSEATFAADADHGSTLAQRWCASCHVVSSAQRVEIDHSPSFASIAQRGDFSAEKLAFFLLEPHPKMPNMSLSRKEADDLAAYIAEQRR